MKKFLTLLVITLFFYSPSLHPREILKYDQPYEGDIKIMGKTYTLPDGQWTFIEEWTWEVYGIVSHGRGFIQIEDGKLKGVLELGDTSIGSSALMEVVAPWIRSLWIENPYDGCYETEDKYYLKYYIKGTSINCLIVSYVDVRKLMNKKIVLDYPWSIIQEAKFKSRAGKMFEVPKILILRGHLYFSTLAGGRMTNIAHYVNPEFYNAGKTISGNESTTEYNKVNLDKYPKKKEFVNKFIKQAEQEHIKFEDFMRARKNHRLELQREEIKQTNVDKDVLKKLKDLNELYKSGVLTKEEFEKAKAKVLN